MIPEASLAVPCPWHFKASEELGIVGERNAHRRLPMPSESDIKIRRN